MLTAAECAIDVLGRRDLEALHAAGERAPIVCLDEQVDMRALQAEVNDPEVRSRCGLQCSSAERSIEVEPAQASDVIDDAEHDVDRESAREHGTRGVRFAVLRLTLRPVIAGNVAPIICAATLQ